MQHTIMCQKVESAMFMQVSDCSKTENKLWQSCKERFKDVKICSWLL